MIELKAVTLERDGVRLEPLTIDHEDSLTAAASDGQLWELRFTSVPEPGQTGKYIKDGVIRHHYMRRDGTVRDSVMYSILLAEWLGVNRRLTARLAKHGIVQG